MWHLKSNEQLQYNAISKVTPLIVNELLFNPLIFKWSDWIMSPHINNHHNRKHIRLNAKKLKYIRTCLGQHVSADEINHMSSLLAIFHRQQKDFQDTCFYIQHTLIPNTKRTFEEKEKEKTKHTIQQTMTS